MKRSKGMDPGARKECITEHRRVWVLGVDRKISKSVVRL